ncbi:MAG: metal-dependent hydrolase [Candidatus Micrarchaeia archaeon]
MPKLAIHLAAGATLFLALATAMPQTFPPTIPALSAMLLASAFPDIDHHKTKIFRTTLAASAIAFAFFAYAALQSAMQPTSAAIAALACGAIAAIAIRILKPRHRGITHSVAAALAFGAFAYFATAIPAPGATQAATQTAIASTLAYAMHLLLDGEVKLF